MIESKTIPELEENILRARHLSKLKRQKGWWNWVKDCNLKKFDPRDWTRVGEENRDALWEHESNMAESWNQRTKKDTLHSQLGNSMITLCTALARQQRALLNEIRKLKRDKSAGGIVEMETNDEIAKLIRKSAELFGQGRPPLDFDLEEHHFIREIPAGEQQRRANRRQWFRDHQHINVVENTGGGRCFWEAAAFALGHGRTPAEVEVAGDVLRLRAVQHMIDNIDRFRDRMEMEMFDGLPAALGSGRIDIHWATQDQLIDEYIARTGAPRGVLGQDAEIWAGELHAQALMEMENVGMEIRNYYNGETLHHLAATEEARADPNLNRIIMIFAPENHYLGARLIADVDHPFIDVRELAAQEHQPGFEAEVAEIRLKWKKHEAIYVFSNFSNSFLHENVSSHCSRRCSRHKHVLFVGQKTVRMIHEKALDAGF